MCCCRSPQYGEVRVRGRAVKEFAQADVWNRAVRYLHTSGEIGIDAVHDSATFAVTDGSFPGENQFLRKESMNGEFYSKKVRDVSSAVLQVRSNMW